MNETKKEGKFSIADHKVLHLLALINRRSEWHISAKEGPLEEGAEEAFKQLGAELAKMK